jgi:hypothetical protein
MAVTRAEIPQTTVRHAYMLTPDTGYIWLTDFSRGTGRRGRPGHRAGSKPRA